jgi:uncharacterized protein YgiM (DUF1202 family)
MPLHNTVRLSAALAFVAVSLAAAGAKAQMSPIRHDTPPIGSSDTTPAQAAATAEAPLPAQPTATSETTPSPSVPVDPVSGNSTPIHAVPLPDGPSTATPIPFAVTPMEGTATPRQAVSLRSGPNTGFPVIGTLQPGMPLRVLASANYGWMQVASPAGTGWTYGSYLAQ